MEKFVTVTLSPVLERTVTTRYMAIGYPNRAEQQERMMPGGQGVNVARALHCLEQPVHAVVLLGSDATGRAYRALVAEEGFEVSVLYVEGTTRSDTCILDLGSEEETHILANGARVSESDIEQLVDTLRGLVQARDVVILAGALPHGVDDDIYGHLGHVIHELGAQVAVVAPGLALSGSLEAQPELVALSRLEAESLFNYPIRVLEDIIGASEKLRQQGARDVLIEATDLGCAILVSEDGRWQIDIPDTAAGTTGGTWEAIVAGFLAGLASQRSLADSLELGGAAAAFVAEQIGSEFGSISEVEEYRDEVDVSPIDDTSIRSPGEE